MGKKITFGLLFISLEANSTIKKGQQTDRPRDNSQEDLLAGRQALSEATPREIIRQSD